MFEYYDYVIIEILFLTQRYEALHDNRFFHSGAKRFFVFLCIRVLAYIRKLVGDKSRL